MDTASRAAPPPPLSHHLGRACRRFLQWPGRVVLLRGRALVQVARLRERVLENIEPAVGSLRRLYCDHISDFVRFVPRAQARPSPRSTEWSHDHHRRTTVEAAG